MEKKAKAVKQKASSEGKQSHNEQKTLIDKIPYKKWQFWAIVGGVIAVLALVFLLIIPKIKEAARTGTYCREDDGETVCIVVDGKNIDFGRNILSSRNIIGTLKNENTVTFSQDDKDAYEEACDASWLKAWCKDGLNDEKIYWGDGSLTVFGMMFEKDLVTSTGSNTTLVNDKNDSTPFATVKDSGTTKGDSKIFHLPKGKYSIKMTTSIDWSGYKGSSSYPMEDIKYELRKCSSNSSYCSFTKTFYTDYFHKDKNETSNSKSTTFEIAEESDYKVEVTDEYADGVKIKSWEITIDKVD